MRTDLHEGDLIGNIVAQLVHAAEAHRAEPHTNSAVLCLPDEAQLRALEARLRSDGGVDFYSVVESEGPYAGQLMAIGFAPTTKDKLKKYLSSIPTLKLGRLRLP